MSDVALSDGELRERALRVLGVLDLRHKPGGHPHNQKNHAGDAVPNVLDKLKLAGRIDLSPDETLVSSRRIRSGQWDVLAAEIDTPTGRQVRLGVIDPRDRGKWTGGPDPRRSARLAELDQQMAAMVKEGGDDATDTDEYARLQDERDELAGDSDDLNRTTSLTSAQVGQLRSDIEAGIASARAMIARDERPDSGEFASGVVAGGLDGDIEWRLDDAGTGEDDDWVLWLAIRPHGEGDDWLPEGDDTASFDPKNIKAFIEAIDELSGGQSDARSLRVPRSALRERELLVRGLIAIGALEARHPAKPPHEQWMHGRRGPKALVKKATHAVVATLADRIALGERSRQPLSGGQWANVDLIELNDGSKVVRKAQLKPIEGRPAREVQDAEELGAAVLRVFGIRAPKTHRQSARVVYQEFMEGTSAETLPRIPGKYDVQGPYYDSDQGRLLGLADALMYNYDRRSANWLFADDGSPIGIDHGMGFAWAHFKNHKPGDPHTHSNDGGFWGYLTHFEPGRGFRWSDNDLAPSDIEAARSRLKQLRSEFDRMNRGEWLDNMLVTLDAIAPHAKGAKARLQ